MNPKKAWTPLPQSKWDKQAAKHLALRIGFSANPAIVEEFLKLEPNGVVQKYLARPHLMRQMPGIVSMRDSEMDFAKIDKKERKERRQELQKMNRKGYAEYAVAWHEFARNPSFSPQEKLSLFFQNVWVVAYQGVKSVPALFEYQNRIRSSLTLSYPEMCKSLALTQAMGRYLNLNKNKAAAPNENFARELFELFTLGEGNYTEQDIKEAARALTGYQFRPDGSVSFRIKAHDNGNKTIFGEKGPHKLEDVLRLIFKQPAAASFLPTEFLRYYLSEQPIDPKYVEELAKMWRKSGYSLPFLYTTVFTSRLFYENEFRGNMIKSPVQYYIGLHQDFDIDILPLPRECFKSSRLMGQTFFNPPNVKGWDGGRAWINSATLAARRQVAETLLSPLNTKRLNADESRALERSRETEGEKSYRIDYANFVADTKNAREASRQIADKLFTIENDDLLLGLATSLIEEERSLTHRAKRTLVFAAITSPAYHLC